MKRTVLTEQMNITFRHRLFNNPGAENHHKKVQIEAIISSTYMPAAPIIARCHLLGSIQESETLQYRQGVSTSTMMPISWHSPPKCLQARPWPNSCNTLVTPNARASKKALCMLKNCWNSGSLERKTSNSATTKSSAERAISRQTAPAGTEKNQRK